MSDENTEQPKTAGSMLDGLPPRWKAGLIVFMWVGLPTGLVLWDKAQEAGWVDDPITAQLEEIQATQQAIQGEIIKLGTMTCVLNAQTDADKKACFQGVRQP